MKNTVKKIIILLSAAAMALSCSLALVNNGDEVVAGEHTVVISGIVSDLDSKKPLQGMKITMQAFPENVLYPLPIVTLTEYTDNNGTFSLEADGLSEVITCKVTVSSPDMAAMPYEPASQEHHISWSGPSFDENNRIFFVNDCNFQLPKTAKP